VDVSSRILITAGPTHEPIDAVRYIANRSSGRLGIALAEAAAHRGHRTTLLLGPTHLQPVESSLLRTIRFQTAADLQALLRTHWPDHDVLIMAAAVADYRPGPPNNEPLAASRERPEKISRHDSPLTLHLEPTPDLLADLSSITRPDQQVIAFALEPNDHLLQSAREKLHRKRVDAIIANPLETMDATTINATMIFADGRQLRAPRSITKEDFAEWLLDHVPHSAESARNKAQA
jgi:phosphopantothenoylcysteine decarboxylase / phosphopantothenate---cysteine ligase